MSEDNKTNVDANTRDFNRGVEAGMNSEDTKFWHAGYELGQELSDRKTKELVKPIIHQDSDAPFFLMSTSEPQDE
jgi:hypothetical protein